MDRDPFVVDISSSDEEVAFDGANTDYFDWLRNFFEAEDGEIGGKGDSDDVIVLGEVLAKPNSANKMATKDGADCVLLDGDPDKPVNEPSDSGDGSDDLIIVGEKGQVACRDYPHARHQCAVFPFNSMPHATHCNLCHCYVCDSPAPCAYWGTGVSHDDHCHATEKAEFWKLERKKVRLGSSAPAPVPKLLGASISTAQPISNYLPLPPQSACSIDSLYTVRPACNGVPAPPQPALCDSSISRARLIHNVVSTPPEVAHSNASVPTTRPLYNRFPPPLQVAHFNASSSTAQPLYNRVPSTHHLSHNSAAYNQVSSPSSTAELTPPFGIPNIISPSRSRMRSFVSARSRGQRGVSQQVFNLLDNNFQRDVVSKVGPRFASSHPTFKKSGVSGRILGPPVKSIYNSSADFNLAYSQHLMNLQQATKPLEANYVSLLESTPREDLELVLRQGSPLLDNVGQISKGSVSSLFQQDGQPPGLPSNSPSIYNQTQNVADPCFGHVTLHSPNSTTQTSQNVSSDLLNNTIQSGQQPLVENLLYEGVVAGDEHLPLTEEQQSFPGFMSPSLVGFGFDSCVLENQSISDAEEGSFFSQIHYQSYVPASTDVGMSCFDFESALKGLAHS
ncbi:hypothetical protein Nepgr_029697 [Nepenthes gracilis]|uniref:RPM1 interacting protein 13 n=1 Tax=Nepenthes gracilis TaxID=150966 RepID=A0AAD3Y5C1_NEPGR|nr:hypothetical protein Nepgr_029697 [Nepenthes gracilis]